MFTLFDGNSTIYPFTDLHSSNTLKDPEWKNLFPIKSFAQNVLIPVKVIFFPLFLSKLTIFDKFYFLRVLQQLAEISQKKFILLPCSA